MSTTFSSINRPAVIVRAWGNEPVVLAAHGLDSTGKWVLVGKPEARRPIGQSVDDVFDYDVAWFNRLHAAYSDGKSRDLEGLYVTFREEIKSSERGCKKYQDALRLAHEEKGQITDS